MSDYEDIEVGGPLDEQRLTNIRERGLWLRNSYDLGPHCDGETPRLVHVKGDGGETCFDRIDLHIGCDCEGCYVLASIPHDPETHEPTKFAALSIIHAGRDLIDLVAEVRELRQKLAAAETAPPQRGGASVG